MQKFIPEMQLPIERAKMQFETFEVTKILIRYYINNRANNISSIFFDTREQWF